MGYVFYAEVGQVVIFDDTYWVPVASLQPPVVISTGEEAEGDIPITIEDGNGATFYLNLSEISEIGGSPPEGELQDVMFQLMQLFGQAYSAARPGTAYQYIPMAWNDPYGRVGDIAHYLDLMFIKTAYGWMYQTLGWW